MWFMPYQTIWNSKKQQHTVNPLKVLHWAADESEKKKQKNKSKKPKAKRTKRKKKLCEKCGMQRTI